MDAMGTKVGGGLYEEVSIENGEPLLLQEKSLLIIAANNKDTAAGYYLRQISETITIVIF